MNIIILLYYYYYYTSDGLIMYSTVEKVCYNLMTSFNLKKYYNVILYITYYIHLYNKFCTKQQAAKDFCALCVWGGGWGGVAETPVDLV